MSSSKPTIFISHAATDKDLAIAIKDQLEKLFAKGVEIFVSSSPGMIEKGEDWLGRVESSLNQAQAIIVLITPISINRQWIWFETGACWARSREGALKIYPLYTSHFKPEELPNPLNRLQATSLARVSDINDFFRSVYRQFDFGNIKDANARAIMKAMPNYDSVRIHTDDAVGSAMYTGPYVGYNDEEFKEILTDYVASAVKGHFRSQIME